jgi:uncharacterized protein
MSTDAQPRQPGIVARCLIGGVQVYRLLLQAWIGNRCRFEPSCSAYATEALRRHGAARGSALATGRLLRCHPWCDGGVDPVPERRAPSKSGLFSRLGLGPAADLSKTRNHP